MTGILVDLVFILGFIVLYEVNNWLVTAIARLGRIE